MQKTKAKKNYESQTKPSHSRQGSALFPESNNSNPFSPILPNENVNNTRIKVIVLKEEARIRTSLESFVIPSCESLISQAKGIE